LIAGCSKWIALAGVLELLSMLGFVLVFKLVFGARMSWRQNSLAGLRALGAGSILPAGGLVGPMIGARAAGTENESLVRLTRSAVALGVVTNAPGVIVLGALGLMLWLGLLSGPHDALLTLPAVAAALGVVAAARLQRRLPSSTHRRSRRFPVFARKIAAGADALREGVTDANGLLVARNWKLVGAVGYYAFDNAVLWAAFHAFGRTPPISVIVMGYLVGSVGSAVPLPAGLGAVEGGLIGALVLYGAPAAPAAAAVLLYRGISLSFPIVLGAFAWACGPLAGVQLFAPPSRRRRAPSVMSTPAG
jgi:uncharacterized membrane protein YbhN (UPF0104 family)